MKIYDRDIYERKPEVAKEWFDKQRIEHVERWAWETYRKIFNVDSMSKIPPTAHVEWAIENDVEHLLPKDIREAA